MKCLIPVLRAGNTGVCRQSGEKRFFRASCRVRYSRGALSCLNRRISRYSSRTSRIIGVELPPFATVAGCLGLVAAANSGEVLLGALRSVEPLQREAGLALGMTERRAFWSVLLPQAWRHSVPGLVNEFTNVLKSSPFAYVAGVPEILKEAHALTATTSRGLSTYAAAALLYLGLYLGCNAAFRGVQRRTRIPGFGEE